MMKADLVNDRIKKQVLYGLKHVAVTSGLGGLYTHGDLKETGLSHFFI